jgi:hypothetical protein
MTAKTSVTLEGHSYAIKPAGTDRHAVYNEFGEHCGYFRVKGKTVTADDYGVNGAHPLVQVGRAWVFAGGAGEDKPVTSKMVAEVHALASAEPADLDAARAHLRWLKTQPGLRTAFCAHDAASGKILAIRVWANRAQMEASKGRTPPVGVKEPATTGVDVLGLIEDL